MFGLRWDSGVLRGLGQAVATMLVASTIIFLPVNVESASATPDAVSEIDYYLDLNGTSQAAYGLENTPALNLGSSDFTVEAWIKPAALVGDQAGVERMILNKELSYEFGIFEGTYQFALMPSDTNFTWQYQNTGIAPLPDQWQHVAFAKSGNTIQFYLNGDEVYSTNSAISVPSSIRSSNLILTLGGRESTTTGNVPNGAWLDGGIDEVRIWTELKSSSEINSAMHLKLDGAQANLLAYWDFNEASGTSVLDRSPNNLDLALHNSPPRIDVKEVSAASDGDTVITFPRTYLPGVGGYTIPEDATNLGALVVGGGGAGGEWIGGGGGGGEFFENTAWPNLASATQSVVVGMGGVKANTSGQSSSFGGVQVDGGSAGGTYNIANPAPGYGSTGGAGNGAGVAGETSTPLARSFNGVASFQNAGGASSGGNCGLARAGGGGGAGGAGGAASAAPDGAAGAGGSGKQSAITGAKYAAGGGGGNNSDPNCSGNGTPGAGGDGGGGNGGAVPFDLAAASGDANTGSGGGGSSNNFANVGIGGSGVVVLRYTPSTDRAFVVGATDLITGTNVIPTANNVPFSIEAWVYPTDLSGWRGILNQTPGLRDGSRRTFLGTQNGVVNFGANAGAFINTGVTIPEDQWTHLAATVGGSGASGQVRIYVNGQLVHTTDSYNRIDTTGSVFHAGGTHVLTEFWAGEIDQIKVWQSVLSADDVKASMHTYSSSGVVASGLQSHYDFNEFNPGTELNRVTNQLALNVTTSVTASKYTEAQIVETGSLGAPTAYLKFKRSYLTALGGWVVPETLTKANGLVVGGGGAGGFASQYSSGGGGGGEVVTQSNLSLAPGSVMAVQVGQGGISAANATAEVTSAIRPTAGQSSTLSAQTIVNARGGGEGASGNGAISPFRLAASNGFFTGGGGGAQAGDPKLASPGSGSAFVGGSAFNHNTSADPQAGGGGAGAGENGYDAASGTAGNGGAGVFIAAMGQSFGGGGGGGKRNNASGTAGIGGSGGGGAGGLGTSGSSGAANSGGGGGGSGGDSILLGGNGGSGVVILAYSLAPDAPRSLTATQSTSHATINLNWTVPTYTGNSAITDYDIEFRPAGGSWTSYSDGVSTATTRAVELPTQCVAHEFRVIAKNASFGSVASATASATPVWGTFDSLTGVQISSNSGCVIKFTDLGAGTWTPPANITSVEAVAVGAGGGGGGGGHQAIGIAGGGGGGAAGLVVTGSVAVTPNQPVSLTVGAGGAGGAGADANPSWIGASGSAGAASSFGLLSASGGEGGWGGGKPEGVATINWIDGAGGQGGSNTNYSPGNGYNRGTHGGSGAGGGGAGSSGNGTAATGNGTNIGVGGAGTTVDGVQLAVGGNGGKGGDATTATAAAASPNTGNGGNGGDGLSTSQAATPFAGADGASGLVIVYQVFVAAPSITSQPQNASAEPGQTKTFTVTTSGNGTLSYQWQSSTDGSNWSNVGTDSSSFTTQTLALADDGIQFRVIVTNTLNGQTSQATSNTATLTVSGATITSGGCSAMVGSDTGVTISETANGGCLVKYTEPGSNTFFVPNLVSSLQAYIVGGGGGGGGAKLGEGGGGGGGGGASRLVTVQVTTSQVIPITVAAGGAGGNANSNGSDGGTSAFSSSFTTPGGKGGKTPTSWPGGGGEGGTGAAGQAFVSSGYSGGNGATDPGDRSYYQPKYGGGGSWRSFAGQLWCVGGGGGGGNREVANDPYFHWEPRAQTCSNGVGVSGGSGGWHNGTTNVLATPGVANTGGGGGGGSYDSSLSIARGGADGADGLVAIYFTPSTGEISLSSVAAFSFSNTTKTITLTKDNPTSDVTWTTSNTAVCTVTGNSTSATVTPHGGGLCEVSVAVSAQSPYAQGSAASSFQIDKISGTAPTWVNNSVSVPFGGTFDLRPQISSPGSNDYTFSTSGTAGSCSVTGYTLTVGNVGDTCNVSHTLVGDAIYLDMAGATPLSVTVTKISQSALVLTSATTMNVNQTLTLSAAGGSGTGALSYHVANQGFTGCVVNSSTGALTATGSGDCEVYAQRALSTNYDPVTSSHVIVTVNKIAQNLSWVSQPQAQYVAGNTYTLEATASSQLAIAYSISSGLCTLAGSAVTFTGSGDCVIEAGQSGDNSYLPAVTISQTVSVGKINQTMTFSALADVSWGSLAFSLSATASSGLNIAYSENNQTTNDACDVSANGIVTIKHVGTCAITATQAGNSAYTAVTTTRLFNVTANQAGAPFIGSVSFGDRQLNASFFTPSYLGGGTVSAYELQAHPLDGSPVVKNTGCIANQGATQSCSVIGLDNGKKYVLRVAAITQAGLGQLSASSSEIIPAANPEAVGNLIAIEGNGTLTLQWTPPTSLGGGTFDQYRIFWRAPGQQYQPNGSPGATVGFQSSTSFVITGLTNGVAYDVKITTTTNANTSELQSNTAEVRQTPFTVPDAPAAVVALDNNNNVVVAWQPPVFDGGNPIDQYVVTKGNSTVCTITSATTTSCEVARPAPGSTEVIEVRAGNDAGLSDAVSTSITVAALPGSNPPGLIGGGSFPGVTPVAAAPIVLDVSGSAVVKTNEVVRLVGTNFNLVEKVLVGNTEASFFVNSAELITIRIPIDVAAGKPVITLQGAFGSRIFSGLIEVSVTQVSIDTKLTIGTFLGYAAVYTKNHEGKRLSMKIGSKWRVIESLGSDYTYNFTKVGKGKTVTVMVYLDRQLVQVKQIKIQ